MNELTRLRSRFVDTPIAIDERKFEILLAAIGPRLNLHLSDAQLERVLADAAVSDYTSSSTSPDKRSFHVTEEGIACIPIQGTLLKRASGIMALSGAMGYEKISAQLDEAWQDREVRGILFDVDSPGGETHGMFELCDLIYSLRSDGGKLIYVSINDNAYSAAYCLASAADRIYCTQTGGAGSIGVFAMHVDQSGADAEAGLKYSYIKAGKKKTDGNPHEPLSKTARTDLQGEVDRQYAMFCECVARNRGMQYEDVQDTEAGVYHAEAAVELGLADEIGTYEDALAALTAAVGAGGMSGNISKISKISKISRSMKDPAAFAARQEGANSKNPAQSLKGEHVMANTIDKEALANAVNSAPEEKLAAAAGGVTININAGSASAAKKMDDMEDDCKDDGKAAKPKPADDQDEDDKKSKKGGAAKPKPANDNDEDDKSDKGKKAAVADLEMIASVCDLAGKPKLISRFMAEYNKGASLQSILNQLQDLRAKEANNPAAQVDANFGAPANGTTNALGELTRKAEALRAASGGKLSVPQALAQVTRENPHLYEQYEDERQEAMHSNRLKREFMSRSLPEMAKMGLTTGGFDRVGPNTNLGLTGQPTDASSANRAVTGTI